MKYKEINVSSIINHITKKDTLFKGKYTIDPYQKCEYGCKYCDSYNDTIYIKNNIETKLKTKIKKIPTGRIIIGSVHDPYQKTEKKYKKTQNILKIIKKNNFPCHILTKSDLILRDLDLLSQIDCMVSITIISLKKNVQKIFENKTPSSQQRFKTLEKLREKNITAGISVIPTLPFIVEDEIEEIIKNAKKHHAKYILNKNLQLKADQKRIFLNEIKKHFPLLLEKYKKMYKHRMWPPESYRKKIDQNFKKNCRKYSISNQIP